ncbi:MAG: purine-nucleoside phosphorylase [Clostridiales bacterium]|jgi:purine-nucleoside phosphorylase|nr:purine-nucleoside phosphorylase [Clostridiales bacterium]
MDYLSKIKDAVDFIEKQPGFLTPKVSIVIGSGLGSIAKTVEKKLEIPYSDIPHFPSSTVAGHSGTLLLGKLWGTDVVIMNGRFHCYEGHSMQTVAFPVAVMNMLGAHTLIVTNASGGVNPAFNAGDLMLITDQICITGDNPLIGPHIPELGGERFDDMSDCYTKALRDEVQRLAARKGINLHSGVYAFRFGPSYETPAEVNMLRIMGADNVAMSTAPEVIMANQCKMRVLGLSCIANKALGTDDARQEKLTHEEVLSVCEKAGEKMVDIIKIAIEVTNEQSTD